MAHPKPSTILNEIEIDTVISFFMYYMDVSSRTQMMNDYPAIYNKLTGREYVKVVRVEDGTHIGLAYTQRETK